MSIGYRKALKREADRERAWRKTRQGAFESALVSLDAHVEKFDDPGKIAVFSDCGAGEERQVLRPPPSSAARPGASWGLHDKVSISRFAALREDSPCNSLY